MNDVNIKELADKAIADMKDLTDIAEGIKAVKTAWGAESNLIKKAFAAVKAAISLITDVVEYVEKLGINLKLAGAQKKALAVAIINRLIDIPWVPENVEAILIDFAIEAIVQAFNRRFGKAWLMLLP